MASNGRTPLDIEEMGKGARIAARCDGQKIEITLADYDRIFVKPISPEQALNLAHELTGFALQMMRRAREG